MTKDSFLLCPPDHFEVTYAINPWMRPGDWKAKDGSHADAADRQWKKLAETITSCGADVHVMPHAKGWPDMVFTANAGIVLDRKAVVANFKFPERVGETVHYARAFETLVEKGVLDEVHMLPDGIAQEGAGDCLWDKERGFFWGAVGPRSERKAYDFIEGVFGQKVEILDLATDEYYHIDVCLSPLPTGHVLCYKPAFSGESIARLEDAIGDKIIYVSEKDASNFVINSVHVNQEYFISSPCTDELREKLESIGLKVINHDFSAFIMAGGSACCLTLKLNRSSSPARS